MTRFARIVTPAPDHTYTPEQLSEDLVLRPDSDSGLLRLKRWEDVGVRPEGRNTVYARPNECAEVVQGSLKVPNGEYTVTVKDGVVSVLLPGPFELNRPS